MTIKATPTPGKSLITANDHTLVMIDFQSQMSFATKSIDAVNLRNNAALVARAAAGFGVSTILTTVAEKSFSVTTPRWSPMPPPVSTFPPS